MFVIVVTWFRVKETVESAIVLL
ncbi:uncharacterized protein METZ01_LOCUS222629 [marine metagenome]|uniref:Uncharacterized protein n=1 Tax=marine metagenome TaxID=408172 RepID=A0A382G4T0_9ZZZZ